MARSARRAGRQPAPGYAPRARAGVSAVLLGAAMLLVGLPLAGVAGAAPPDVTSPLPTASASAWAPLVTIAIVTAVLGGIMFWRARRAARARRP